MSNRSKDTMKQFVKSRFQTSFDKLYDADYFKNKKAFAEVLDVSPQFLSQLLNGPTPVPLELLQKLIERFPINPGFLFNRHDREVFLSSAPHLQRPPMPDTLSIEAGADDDRAPETQRLLNGQPGDLYELFKEVSASQLRIMQLFERLLNERTEPETQS